jgi:hypothetical protein
MTLPPYGGMIDVEDRVILKVTEAVADPGGPARSVGLKV